MQQRRLVQKSYVNTISLQHVSSKLKRVSVRGIKGKVLASAEIN